MEATTENKAESELEKDYTVRQLLELGKMNFLKFIQKQMTNFFIIKRDKTSSLNASLRLAIAENTTHR
jgi:hypothetical protein